MSNAKPHTEKATESFESAAVWFPIEKLKAWENNPRKNDHAVDGIAKSIESFGFGAPIIARKSNNEVIAGHTRLKAAAKLKMATVPVRFLDIDAEQAHLLALADNRLGENAEWDDEMLGAVIADLKAQGADLDLSGFDETELDGLLDSSIDVETDERDADAQHDRADELQKKWGTERGQVWKIGAHRLMCGDCRVSEDVAKLMGATKAAIAFTSPPYASQRTYDAESGFTPIHPDKFVEWFDAVQSNVRAHLADDGSWFVNIKEHCDDSQRHLYVKDLTIAHVRTWKWLFVDELCWTKAAVPGGWPNRFKNGWEPVFHFATRKTIKFRPESVSTKSDGVFAYSPDNGKSGSSSGLLGARPDGFVEGMARPSNVVNISAAGRVTGDHPAEFPADLPEWFIKAFSDAGDAVYEPFSGAGSTLVACERTRRVGFGMELSPKYVAVALERMSAIGCDPVLSKN